MVVINLRDKFVLIIRFKFMENNYLLMVKRGIPLSGSNIDVNLEGLVNQKENYLSEFENKINNYLSLNSKEIVGLSSGTSAIHISLILSNINFCSDSFSNSISKSNSYFCR